MLSSFFHRHESALRQQCREWFLASRHALLSYARQQVDDMTDVELLTEDVARRVTQAIVAGRVSVEDITPYTLRALHNAAPDWRKKNAKRLQTERRYSEEVYDAAPAAPSGQGAPVSLPKPDGSSDTDELRYQGDSLPEHVRKILAPHGYPKKK